MGRRSILDSIAREITKYKIVVKGLSILPFAFYFSVYYIPTGEEVGYVKWSVFQGVEGEIKFTLDSKAYYLRYRNGEWTISEG